MGRTTFGLALTPRPTVVSTEGRIADG